MGISARASTLRQLFSSGRRFVSPHFQRPYAWTVEEAGKLLADLLLALEGPERPEPTPAGTDEAGTDEATNPTPAPNTYFLGAIVLVDDPATGDTQVVDGLQRLTTITLLLAALRDLEPDLSAPLAELLAASDGSTALRLRDLDASFLQDHVLNAGATTELTDEAPATTDAQMNLVTNTVLLRERLEALAPADRARVAEFLLDQTYVVDVMAANAEQGFRVFTVMNDRGQDLRDNDILKSELLGLLSTVDGIRLADAWEGLEVDLGREEFANLFSYIRTIHRPYRQRRSIFEELRETLQPQANPAGFIERELLPKGRILRHLLGASMRYPAREDEINVLLKFLNRLSNRDWVPVALAYFAAKPRPANEAFAFLKELDRLAYGLFIQGGDDNLRMARYRKPIEAIRAGADLEALRRAMALSPAERRQARSVLNGNFYSKERIRLPVMLRIDYKLSAGVQWIEYDDVTVEHVLPQNPPEGSPWLQAFPDARERKRLTNKLGNLVLLTRRKNLEAANYPFERKIYEYFAHGGITPFAITTQVLQEREWTQEIVKRRQEVLVRAACEIWDL